jgi:hypothetical protein
MRDRSIAGWKINFRQGANLGCVGLRLLLHDV